MVGYYRVDPYNHFENSFLLVGYCTIELATILWTIATCIDLWERERIYPHGTVEERIKTALECWTIYLRLRQ